MNAANEIFTIGDITIGKVFLVGAGFISLKCETNAFETVLPKTAIISQEESFRLNHNGTREDRERAFRENDYVSSGWILTLRSI